MTDKQPIDYARAEPAVVIRWKSPPRIFWFAIATFLVFVIGFQWMNTMNKSAQFIDSDSLSAASFGGEIHLRGPFRGDPRTVSPTPTAPSQRYFRYSNRTFGFEVRAFQKPALPKWDFTIRYRTIFTLAMIPWIITLIRMIRARRRMHRLETET